MRSSLLVLLLGISFAMAQDAGEPPLPAQSPDLRLPAQEAFKGWPPTSLRERPYWLPWHPLAFGRAALFDRPILLLLTPPWSHDAQRMQDEALADPKVLRFLNAHFITVYVNSDRHPDLAERYRTGSWPVLMLLLPDGTPMISDANPRKEFEPIATTRLPADQLLFILREGRKYYNLRKEELLRGGRYWLEEKGEVAPIAGSPDLDAASSLVDALMGSRDGLEGGFGIAPKYVLPGLIELGRLRAARGDDALLGHARLTLHRLVASPLYDRREGGVHRIALRPDWGGIQYEKLLDRNAALLHELTLALRDEPAAEDLRQALVGTAGFIVDRLSVEDGGLANGQGADAASADGGGYWRGEGSSPPRVDASVYTGPNAMAGAALLRAGAFLGDARLTARGNAVLEALMARISPARGVPREVDKTRDFRRDLASQSDTALGLLDAHEFTGRDALLDAAEAIVRFTWSNLRQPDEPVARDRLAVGDSDRGLLPSPRRPLRGNTRLARAMIRLAKQGRGDEWLEVARGILGYYAGSLSNFRQQGLETALAIEELVSALDDRGDEHDRPR